MGKNFVTQVQHSGLSSVVDYVRHPSNSIEHLSVKTFFSFDLSVLLVFLALLVSYYSKRRRALKDLAERGPLPPMTFAPQFQGTTMASNYDPNGPQYPAQTYPFLGHGAVCVH
jgi:hypothetical protein